MLESKTTYMSNLFVDYIVRECCYETIPFMYIITIEYGKVNIPKYATFTKTADPTG